MEASLHTANDKKLLGKKLDCVHLYQLYFFVFWHSVASVGTRSQLKELVQ